MSYSSEFDSISETDQGSLEEHSGSESTVKESPSTSISLPSGDGTLSTEESIQTVIETPVTPHQTRQSVASRPYGTPFTDSPAANYQDETFETLSPTYSSGKYTSSFESPGAGFQTPDVLDLSGKEARQDFLVRKLELLQMKPRKDKGSSSKQKDVGLGRSGRSFINKKVKLLKQYTKEGQTKAGQTPGTCATSEKLEFRDENPGAAGDITVPFGSALQRLKMDNFMHDLKQASSAEIHDVNTCQACLKHNEEASRIEFLKQKLSIVHNKAVQEKLEEHLYLRDPLTLIGNIMKDLPTLQDNPEDIWARLNEPFAEQKENT
ncbi:uncharacterized protein C8orf48 homolog [Lingula anatina]|uniref:Uncharacterized protein C8orf48 homolog n=1 Tax=Lingula anatina TaxID=7574 RepID=A0A1S3KCD9_LINAN|nr:uncharacterized protein C8orf48 homolog [Lingula anatina]|eukprot:XP_013420300.1 uncharacterized protein C8orf48 homolog [Lingula anatina]